MSFHPVMLRLDRSILRIGGDDRGITRSSRVMTEREENVGDNDRERKMSGNGRKRKMSRRGKSDMAVRKGKLIMTTKETSR